MAHELTLKMEKPIEELVPAMIAWNNAELMQDVKVALERYQGLTYTEEQVDAAKKDRALLNAFCKSLNDERIRISKIYSAPYEKFKGEVDEVLGTVKAVVSEIDTQVKSFDDARKARKEELIKEYFHTAVGAFEPVLKYEKIRQEKWLNKSTSMLTVKADIDKAVADAGAAMIAIESLHSEDEEVVKAYYFRTLNIGDALMENDRLKQERERIAALSAKPKEPEVPQTPTIPEPQKEEKMYAVDFHCEGTLEQMKALKHFLHTNNIKYSKI